MFVRTLSGRTRLEFRRGYSVLELVASILLIAAIAVLSLPTYYDFTPHDGIAVQRVPVPATGERNADDPLSAEGRSENQPGGRPVSENEENRAHEDPKRAAHAMKG